MYPFRDLGLAGRLSLSLTVTLVVVGGAVTLGIIHTQRNRIIGQAEAEHRLRVDLARRTLESAMLRRDPEQIQSLLRSLVDGRVVTDAGVFDARTNRQVFGARTERIGTPAAPQDVEALSSTDEVTRELGRGALRTVVPISNEPACQGCHDAGRAVLGGLYLETSTAPMEADLATLRNVVLAVGALLVLLQVGVVVAVVRRLVRKPLKELAGVVGRVEQGDLAVRIDSTRRDELGRFTRALGRMVEGLARSREELERIHASQMQRADKYALVGNLAANLAHEIKNPLAGMDGALKVLAEQEHLTNSDRYVIGQVEAQIERIDRIVEQLLRFARPAPPRFVQASPAEVMDRCLALIRGRAQQQSVRVEKNDDGRVPPIRMDPVQIQQVFLNILVNSLDELCDGGHIRISLRMEETPALGRWVRVTFDDDGRGVAPEVMARIFDPFFSTKLHGAGLGLAVGRDIVDAHGGRIELDSAPGRGARFVVSLPARDARRHWLLDQGAA